MKALAGIAFGLIALFLRSSAAAETSKLLQTNRAISITTAVSGNIFDENAPIALTLNDTLRAPMNYAVTAIDGTSLFSGSATPGTTVSLPAQPPGLYFVNVKIAERDNRDEAKTSFAVLPPVSNGTDATRQFGVNTSAGVNVDGGDIAAPIARLGLRALRDGDQWQGLEQVQGELTHYNTNVAALIPAFAALGGEAHLICAFGNVFYDNYEVDGVLHWDLPSTTNGRAGFVRYCSTVAAHFGAAVDSVAVWNEVNGAPIFCPGPACKFGNRLPNYAALANATVAGVTRPPLLLVGAAISPGTAGWIPYFRVLFRDGLSRTGWDALDIHVYHEYIERAEGEITALASYTAGVTGSAPAIWVTEFGSLAHSGGDFSTLTLRQIASYLWKSASVQLGQGVQRMYYYVASSPLDPYALFIRQGSGAIVPTPAAVAYFYLIRELSGASFVAQESTDPNNRVYHFLKNGQDIRIAWAVVDPKNDYSYTPSTISFPANETQTVLDVAGNTTTVAPQDGIVSIALGNEAVIIGGAL